MSQATTFGRRAAVAPPPLARPSAPPPQALPPAPPPTAGVPLKEASLGGYFLWLLFGFSGRLNRTNYRYARVAANMTFLFSIYALASAIRRNTGNIGLEAMLLLLGFALSVLMMWTTLAMQIKRRHDRDKAWPWLFTGFIPFIGPFWVLIETCWLDGTPGYNRFDDPRDLTASTFS